MFKIEYIAKNTTKSEDIFKTKQKIVNNTNLIVLLEKKWRRHSYAKSAEQKRKFETKNTIFVIQSRGRNLAADDPKLCQEFMIFWLFEAL